MTITEPRSAEPDPPLVYEAGEIEADGFTVRYRVAGTGRPLLVLHGAGGSRSTRGLELLARSSRVFLVELPGFGEEVNDRTRTAEQMGATVLAIADALDLEGFDLLGTSMGGVVAAWVAVQGGERIEHLVLESPAAFRPDRDPAALTPEEMFRAFHAHPERKTITPPDPERQHRTWPLVQRLVGPVYDETLAGRLTDLSAPALALFGAEDGLFGTAPGNEYRRLIPSCTFAIVYDAAHDISGDRPEAFASTVRDFLARGSLFVIQNRSTLIHP